MSSNDLPSRKNSGLKALWVVDKALSEADGNGRLMTMVAFGLTTQASLITCSTLEGVKVGLNVVVSGCGNNDEVRPGIGSDSVRRGSNPVARIVQESLHAGLFNWAQAFINFIYTLGNDFQQELRHALAIRGIRKADVSAPTTAIFII